MQLIDILRIKGDEQFNKDHKVFQLKDNQLTEVTVRKIDDDSIEVVTFDDTYRLPCINTALMSIYEKAKMFDVQNNISGNTYLCTEEMVLRILDLSDILREVCKYYVIPISLVETKTRKREVVWCRQVSHYFAKALTTYSLAKIGANIGSKDHATVLHSCKVVANILDTDVRVRDQVYEIEKRLRLGYKIKEKTEEK